MRFSEPKPNFAQRSFPRSSLRLGKAPRPSQQFKWQMPPKRTRRSAPIQELSSERLRGLQERRGRAQTLNLGNPVKLEPSDLGLTPGCLQRFSQRPENPGSPTSCRKKRREWKLVAWDAEGGGVTISGGYSPHPQSG